MEKQISKMNISTDILNGVTKQSVTCPYCKKQFSIQLINKHIKQKTYRKTTVRFFMQFVFIACCPARSPVYVSPGRARRHAGDHRE